MLTLENDEQADPVNANRLDDAVILSPARQRDLQRVARIAAKDKAAMKELYEEFSAPLTAFVTRWVRNPHEAPDIVNDVMIEVWQKAHRYEGRAALKSWVFTIARNKAVDSNRKQGRMTYTDEVPEVIDAAPGAVSLIEKKQSATTLDGCMETLSAPHRRAVHLAYFEDMGYAEIAKIEDRPVGTIKTRILHAKKLLARCMSMKDQAR